MPRTLLSICHAFLPWPRPYRVQQGLQLCASEHLEVIQGRALPCRVGMHVSTCVSEGPFFVHSGHQSYKASGMDPGVHSRVRAQYSGGEAGPNIVTW